LSHGHKSEKLSIALRSRLSDNKEQQTRQRRSVNFTTLFITASAHQT